MVSGVGLFLKKLKVTIFLFIMFCLLGFLPACKFNFGNGEGYTGAVKNTKGDSNSACIDPNTLNSNAPVLGRSLAQNAAQNIENNNEELPDECIPSTCSAENYNFTLHKVVSIETLEIVAVELQDENGNFVQTIELENINNAKFIAKFSYLGNDYEITGFFDSEKVSSITIYDVTACHEVVFQCGVLTYK